MSNSTLLSMSFHDRFAHIEAYDPDAQLVGKQRSALLLIAALVILTIVGGIIVPIGGAVIGSGQVGSESQIKRISHPSGGTISQILVENGQHVHKGQVLIRLDDKVSGADASLAALTVEQMLAQKARLEAERLGQGDILFPDMLTQNKSASAQRAMADERRMFAIKHAEKAGLTSQLNARIGQYEQQIAAYNAQIAALHQQRVLIEPERNGVRELYRKQLVTLSRLNQLERTAVDLNGSIGSLNAQIAEARARISETRQQIIQLGESRRSEAGDQIAQINNQLNQQQVRSISASDTQDRTVIRAPYDGVVEKLSATTIGGVIRPADILMEIVPDKVGAVVEGNISPSDIDQVQVGKSARIRLSALSITTTPELSGKVVYIASERVTDQEQRSYFPVRIAIDRSTVAAAHVQLKAGLPAEIYIETGDRSMLSYLTKPLRDQFARTFRDN